MKKITPESRIELTCIATPLDTADPVEISREDDTRAEWHKAKEIARRFKINSRFSYHNEDGCKYGDGYLYPSLNTLEKVLDDLDKEKVGYDNIDLPSNAHEQLIKRLKERYKYGVFVNENRYP